MASVGTPFWGLVRQSVWDAVTSQSMVTNKSVTFTVVNGAWLRGKCRALILPTVVDMRINFVVVEGLDCAHGFGR